MQYAVNVGDLTRDHILGAFLVGPLVPSRRLVHAEPGRIDGGAVVLECDEKQALGVVGVIRMKYPPHLIRCYESKTGNGGWKRMGAPKRVLGADRIAVLAEVGCGR